MRRICSLLLAGQLHEAASFGFTVDPQQTECFQETAHESDHVQGEWSLMVGSADLFKVKVMSPSGDSVYSVQGEKAGEFDYYATVAGSYSLCFSSETASGGPAVEVSAKIHIGDPPDLIQLAKTEHLTPIEERIKNVRGGCSYYQWHFLPVPSLAFCLEPALTIAVECGPYVRSCTSR